VLADSIEGVGWPSLLDSDSVLPLVSDPSGVDDIVLCDGVGVSEGVGDVPPISATAVKASSKARGNRRSLALARRRIPAQAFGLKKNLVCTSVSRISDSEGWEEGKDEHPASSLGDPVLGVDSPPCNVHCPAFGQ